MESTRRLEIELPEDLADGVRADVESGRFANESEAVAAALTVFREQDEEDLEDGVRAEIAAGYDAWKANPGDVYTVEEVLAHLEERRQNRR